MFTVESVDFDRLDKAASAGGHAIEGHALKRKPDAHGVLGIEDGGEHGAQAILLLRLAEGFVGQEQPHLRQGEGVDAVNGVAQDDGTVGKGQLGKAGFQGDGFVVLGGVFDREM
ncbi:MAG: hypothetical protein ACREDT_05590 [Methylocella sp.]